MMRTVVAIGALLGLAVLLCCAFWAGSAFWTGRQTSKSTRQLLALATSRASQGRAPSAPMARPPALALMPAQVVVTSARAPVPPDDASLMRTLRALGDSEPARSLQLAREAERRFPDSLDAPERAWYVCKSLVNLERFYDAREEARRMVDEYPASPWAADVARHLLVNPLELPGAPRR